MSELPIFIHSALRNQRDQVTPTAYQTVMTTVVERHFNRLRQGNERIMRTGKSLVYLATSTVIFRPYLISDQLACRVWLSDTRGVAPRLEIECWNHTREERAFAGAVWFSIIDLETRSLIREPGNVVDFSRFDHGEPLFEGSSRCSLDSSLFRTVGEAEIMPSWIDTVGHCDNVRYYDLAYDVLSEEERLSMDRLCRTDVFFQRELVEHERVRIGRWDQDGVITLAGMKEDGRTAFTCRLYFRDAAGELEE